MKGQVGAAPMLRILIGTDADVIEQLQQRKVRFARQTSSLRPEVYRSNMMNADDLESLLDGAQASRSRSALCGLTARPRRGAERLQAASCHSQRCTAARRPSQARAAACTPAFPRLTLAPQRHHRRHHRRRSQSLL